DDADALDSRGYAHQRHGDLDAAIADYSAAIKIDPLYYTALFGRGVAYAAQGKRDLAIADLTAARALNAGVDQYMADKKILVPAGL
ncbi:MAG TPA: tetratricopeptide repeat protein, partial [Ktedonobacterales bacterium]